MKAVMISIKPEWCEKIASGKKTIEVRKTKPNIPIPFKCYIYQTKFKWVFNLLRSLELDDIADALTIGFGKVIGEFVCDRITYFGNVATDPWKHLVGSVHEEHKRMITEKACLTENEMLKYKGRYGWHISNLVIYDKPKDLSEFFVWKKCNSCRRSGYESTACGYDEDCKVPAMITRPPQSWCYVEEE